jgi:hypothetical protein
LSELEAGAEIFDKLEPEPELEADKNGPAPPHWWNVIRIKTLFLRFFFVFLLSLGIMPKNKEERCTPVMSNGLDTA